MKYCKIQLCGMPLLSNEDEVCDICKSGIRYIMNPGDEERLY